MGTACPLDIGGYRVPTVSRQANAAAYDDNASRMARIAASAVRLRVTFTNSGQLERMTTPKSASESM